MIKPIYIIGKKVILYSEFKEAVKELKKEIIEGLDKQGRLWINANGDGVFDKIDKVFMEDLVEGGGEK